MFNKNISLYYSYYNILGTDICLESPREEINKYCDFLLKNFTIKKLPGDYSLIKVEEDFILQDHYTVYKNGKVAHNLGDELSAVEFSILPNLLENVICGHAINQINKRDLITLHSGALTKNGKGILIIGESGNGKSTLTLELTTNHNWGYLSDEVGLIDNSFTLQPFRKTISFIPGVVKLNPCWKLKKYGIKHQVEIPEENYGNSAPLKAIFFVKYNKDKKPEIQQLKKSESLILLNKAQIGRAKFTASFEQMTELVKRINSYIITHNDCSKAADLIQTVMDLHDI